MSMAVCKRNTHSSGQSVSTSNVKAMSDVVKIRTTYLPLIGFEWIYVIAFVRKMKNIVTHRRKNIESVGL